MTNKKLSKQRLEKFFKIHGSAAASIVCANLDSLELIRAIEIIEGECIKAGDLRTYQKVVDAIVDHRKMTGDLVDQYDLDPPEGRADHKSAAAIEGDAALFPPIGAIRQLDPKVAGIPWIDGGQLKVRLADQDALLERFKSEQRELGNDNPSSSHLIALKLGKPRILTRTSRVQLDELLKLKQSFPHFEAVTNRIYTALHARMLAGSHTKFPNLLLVGGPGLGKTAYIAKISTVLRIECHELSSMGNDHISLVGLRPPWKSAQPGTVANVFKINNDEEGTANKLIFIDEIDKASTMASSEQASSAGMFEQLLSSIESGTGKFVDSYLGNTLPLDVKFCSWVFAANDCTKIPQYFLSRTEQFFIENPSGEHFKKGLLASIFQSVLSSAPYSAFFVQRLSAEVIDLLAEAGKTPREIRRLLDESLEKSMSKYSAPPEMNSIWLTPEDFSLKSAPIKRRSIGFISDTEVAR